MPYYDTLNLSPEELKKRNRSTESQTNRVYRILSSYKRPKSASRIHWRYLVQYCGLKMSYSEYCDTVPSRPPLTSIRRCLTDLQSLGMVVKAGRDNGLYGSPEFTWKTTK